MKEEELKEREIQKKYFNKSSSGSDFGISDDYSVDSDF